MYIILAVDFVCVNITSVEILMSCYFLFFTRWFGELLADIIQRQSKYECLQTIETYSIRFDLLLNRLRSLGR